MKTETVIGRILAAGLSAVEHENNGDFPGEVMHITLIGGVRRVEFYPSTGTVYANAVKGQYPATSLKNSNVDAAIRVARKGG